jgi:hypothetical protein
VDCVINSTYGRFLRLNITMADVTTGKAWLSLTHPCVHVPAGVLFAVE